MSRDRVLQLSLLFLNGNNSLGQDSLKVLRYQLDSCLNKQQQRNQAKKNCCLMKHICQLYTINRAKIEKKLYKLINYI